MKQKISLLMYNKYLTHKQHLPKYNPTADFNWIKHHSGLPWLQLSLTVPYEIILNEISNIESLLVAHRDDYGEHQGWKSFCIHGKSYDATREDTFYKDTRPYGWTPEAISLMPNTVEYFKNSWPTTNFARLRVMLLEPGGYVSIHRDSDKPLLAPINIAITQPTGCNFVMEKHGAVPFTTGSVFWLDVSNNHTVFNNSNQPRWHIIVHQNEDSLNFQNEVVKSYNILYNSYNENRNDCN